MTRKMHAAIVEQFGKPLVFREVDIPTPGPGQILVRITAAGIGLPDVLMCRGAYPLTPPLPFTPHRYYRPEKK